MKVARSRASIDKLLFGSPDCTKLAPWSTERYALLLDVKTPMITTVGSSCAMSSPQLSLTPRICVHVVPPSRDLCTPPVCHVVANSVLGACGESATYGISSSGPVKTSENVSPPSVDRYNLPKPPPPNTPSVTNTTLLFTGEISTSHGL